MYGGQVSYARFFKHWADCGDFFQRGLAAQQVIQRQHTVCFAAAEGRFQLNNRLAVFAGHTSHRLHQQALHALRHIGAGKKLYGITIFKGTFATCHLRKVCRKFSVTIAPLSHIGVRLHHITPAGKSSRGNSQHSGIAVATRSLLCSLTRRDRIHGTSR